MIYITPNAWLCEAHQKTGDALDQYFTPRQYLWHQYQGDMQPAPDSVLITALYDITQDIRLTHRGLMDYRFLQRTLPFFCDTLSKQQAPERYTPVKTLIESLPNYGLWESSHILKTAKPLSEPCSGLGWSHIPPHLKAWIKPIDAPQKAETYLYEDIDDTLVQNIAKCGSKEVVILETGERRAQLKTYLLREGLAFDEDQPTRFENYPVFIKILGLLELDRQTIEPKHLVQLLWMPGQSEPLHLQNLFARLHAYPKPFCTQTELKRFLQAEPCEGQLWLEALLDQIPEPRVEASMQQCITRLQALLQHLQWPEGPLWPLWLKMFGSSQIIHNRRPYGQWWALLRCQSALISVPLKAQASIQIANASRALYGPKQVLFMPSALNLSPLTLPSLPAASSLVISQMHQQEQVNIMKRYEFYKRDAKALLSTQRSSTHTWLPRTETNLSAPTGSRIRWVRNIQTYTRCPRYGWIHEHLLPETQGAISFDLNPAMRGMLIHAWMQSNHLTAPDFIKAWFQKRGLPLLALELEALSSTLELIKEHWNALKSAHPWMDDAPIQEQKYSLELEGYQGELRLDLVLRHPKGLVIIDFKTSLTSLSPLSKHAGLAPQLPLYWLAQKEEVVGLGYAYLSPNGIQLSGIAKVAIGLFPKTHDETSWESQKAVWQSDIVKTLQLIKSNNTDQAPFAPHHTCEICSVKMLCKPQ